MDTSSQPPPSRRLRYSLRTVLIVMLAAGILFSQFSPRIRRARNQGAAVKALREAQQPITITYNYQQVDADGTVALDAPGPAWIRGWLGDDFFDPVVAVDWGATYPTYSTSGWIIPKTTGAGDPTLEQLSHLSAFRELRELNIAAPIPDEGLVPIGTLTGLERLILSGQGWAGAGAGRALSVTTGSLTWRG